MSEQERGAYTPPTDEPLAFDARRQTGERRPVPMTLIASGVVLAVLVVAVVLFYRSGVRGREEAPNVVGAPVAAVKTAPAQEAQPIDEAAGLDVYVSDQTPAAGQPNFAPAPEQPLARPAPQAQPMPAPAPAPAPTAPVSSGALRPAQPAATAPAQTAQAPAAPAPKPAAPTQVAQAPAASGGSAAVQIGAFSSTSIADAEFAKIAKAFPQFASGKAKRVEPVERDGKTLYRTAFTGFASKSDAQAFCSALKAAGQACLVK